MFERLFLAVPRGCLQFVIVVFPDHTHLLFLRTQDNFSWASSCFVGPPAIGKSIALKITSFESCDIAWFSWQQQCASKQLGMSLQITYISAETHPKVLKR